MKIVGPENGGPGTGNASVIQLNYTKGLLKEVVCKIGTEKKMDSMQSFTLFGSKPCGNSSEFYEMAFHDIWSTLPRLSSNLKSAESDAEVTGSLTEMKFIHDPQTIIQPYLRVTWKFPIPTYRQFYKCVANGLNDQKQAVTISTTIKAEFMNENVCEWMDSIDSQFPKLSENIKQSLADISAKLPHFHSTSIKAMDGDSAYFTRHMKEIESSLAIMIKTNSYFQWHALDMSERRDGRVYIVSNRIKKFDLMKDNNACKDMGGYLVELNDNDEYRFVFDFIASLAMDAFFFTGMIDAGPTNEGKFFFFNSLTKAPLNLDWRHGQPDNYGDVEHCVEVSVGDFGLNDIRCDREGRFVCEVESPLHFEKKLNN
ncbi:collectin-11 [Plakobranchus ocellatus]|uniref:Collectin-11 n=1 Tax=Plakobranchus ocellatus TaxID=259542 RepID=A0AAV4DAT2_9GAST|nr:collectin-11 [Plakobranchus ocellatus]